MTPRQVVKQWVAAFNARDIDRLASLYHEEAINHQVVTDPVIGRTAIIEMFAREFAAADMHCVPENLFEDGEWAILEWHEPTGLRGCGFFHVIDGLIEFQRGYWDRQSFDQGQRLT